MSVSSCRTAVMVGLGEDAAGTAEAPEPHRQGLLGSDLLLQGLHQDALQPAHVDEVDVQSPAAGGVQALCGVALAEAQQLVPLPDLGPRERTAEEPIGFGNEA